MKLETFFEKFDQFADAPDAVAKMRELVLQLAVQGKLVEQAATMSQLRTVCSEFGRQDSQSMRAADADQAQPSAVPDRLAMDVSATSLNLRSDRRRHAAITSY